MLQSLRPIAALVKCVEEFFRRKERENVLFVFYIKPVVNISCERFAKIVTDLEFSLERRTNLKDIDRCSPDVELEGDSDIGYIVEVDLLYPEHLHNMHNDLPLAPEHVLVTYDMLSNYSKISVTNSV
ncbi:hypothetical protein CEXT_761551 [Caerostris extrusa]|uniref:Uncharacterized protein n=1 Tax=Caerostris extrusa TaxID=172846 RepID=A0AAV4UHW5_CAEEX|nr:hypothetical protein CEXT_761551 [Caerostris extrusa]